MPQPTTYNRQFNFANWSKLHPTIPHPGQSHDAELNAVKLTLDQVLANLKLIQRDDGRLANLSVGRDQLGPGLLVGFEAPGPWEPDTPYPTGRTVFALDSFWICVSEHTSGPEFDDANWSRIANLAEAAASGVFHSGSFTGDGSTTVFDLGHVIGNAARVVWVEDGEIKQPNVDYTVAGTVVQRAEAPTEDGFWFLFGQISTVFNTVDDGAVTTPKLADAAVATSKIQNGAVTREKVGEAAIGADEIGDNEIAQRHLPAGFTLVPIGVVAPFAGAAAPAGWQLCYGQAVSRSAFAGLFAAIGTAYGSGDGSTTFNLPDMRGRVPAGRDNMGDAAAGRLTNSGTGNPGVNGAVLGAVGGVDRHALTTGQMPTHNHSGSTGSAGNHSHNISGRPQQVDGIQSGSHPTTARWTGSTTISTGSAGAHTHSVSIGNAGSGQAHPNVQPTIVMNYIIYTGVE